MGTLNPIDSNALLMFIGQFETINLRPLLYQLIHNVLLECSPAMKQMLLAPWQTDVTQGSQVSHWHI